MKAQNALTEGVLGFSQRCRRVGIYRSYPVPSTLRPSNERQMKVSAAPVRDGLDFCRGAISLQNVVRSDDAS